MSKIIKQKCGAIYSFHKIKNFRVMDNSIFLTANIQKYKHYQDYKFPLKSLEKVDLEGIVLFDINCKINQLNLLEA